MRPSAPERSGRVRVRAGAALLILLLPYPARLAAAPPAVQAGIPPGDTVRIDTLRVIVTRTRRPVRWLPQAYSTVDASGVASELRGLSLDESLRRIPGLAIGGRRNESQGDRLAIRGAGARAQFGVRGVRVLADGIPLTLADGQAVLYNLDLGSIGRIETLRGPSSVRYGNAGGGVVSFDTRHVVSRGWRIRPLLQAGTYGYTRFRVGAELGLSAGGGVLDLSRVASTGFREYSSFEARRLNLVARFNPGRTTWLRGVVNIHDMPFAENPGALTLEEATTEPRSVRPLQVTQGTGKSSTQGQAGLTVRQRLGAEGEIEATVWGLTRQLWNAIPFRIIDLDRQAGGLRSEARGRLAVGGGGVGWLAGLDFEWLGDDRREYVNAGVPPDGDRGEQGNLLLEQRETVRAVSPFADLQILLGSHWRLNVAARWDTYRFVADDYLLADGDDSGQRTFRELSPSAGLLYSPSPALSAWAGLGTGFTTPTTSELSNRPGGGGGFNPDLDPERLEAVEAGVRGAAASGRITYELSGYLGRVSDALVPVEGPTEEAFVRNAGRLSRDGVELRLALRPLPPLVANLSATVQRNRFDRFHAGEEDVSGNVEPGVPLSFLHAGLAWQQAGGFRAAIDFRWTDSYAANDANTAWNPAWRVIDLRVGYQVRLGTAMLDLFGGIDNLTDERYNGSVVPNAFGERYFEPAPGTEFYIGLSADTGA